MKPGAECSIGVLRPKRTEHQIEDSSVHMIAEDFQLYDCAL